MSAIHGDRDGCRRSPEHDSLSTDIGTGSSTTESTFSWRSVLMGILIGAIISFASVYYGLQSGKTNSMPLPSALLGFACFKPLLPYLKTPFNPKENVLVMTVAASMGGIPFTTGITGIIPALEYLLSAADNGPLKFPLHRLFIWSLGVCLFGVVLPVPLRDYFVKRSRLRFPTGTAMAAVIGMLHRRPSILENIKRNEMLAITDNSSPRRSRESIEYSHEEHPAPFNDSEDQEEHTTAHSNLAANPPPTVQSSPSTLLEPGSLIGFGLSGLSSIITYLFPTARRIPLFGFAAAQNWAWSVALSPAYIGYGMIMSPMTTAQMLFGAVISWGILSPLAKGKGWAPGPVGEWQTGSQGWVTWPALGVILGDSMIGIIWVFIRLCVPKTNQVQQVRRLTNRREPHHGPQLPSGLGNESAPLLSAYNDDHNNTSRYDKLSDEGDRQFSTVTILFWLCGVSCFCFLSSWFLFREFLSFWEVLLAIVLIVPLGIASVRSMGERDNSLASSLGKVSQIIFGILIPSSNPNTMTVSLVVGGISEGGLYQSSDVMEHLKTGYLAGAAPKSLFYGQVIGSIRGAIWTSCVYRLFTSIYVTPSERFPAPSAQLWLATAKVVYEQGLPEGVLPFVIAGFFISAGLAVAKILGDKRGWSHLVPSGVAIGIGMYILPMYTIPQALGGLLHYYYQYCLRKHRIGIITIALGLILGESLVNIFTLILTATGISRNH